MSHLDILVPFALPDSAMGRDLLRAMQTPALALLLGRSLPMQHRMQDAFARMLPHEMWLTQTFGMLVDPTADCSAPVALQVMQQFHELPGEGTWFLLNPVHLHVARDHLVLTDWRRLGLSETESRELFALAEPLFEDSGKALVYGDAAHWFARADNWRGLKTATPDASCGHNIDIWMPTGLAERDWRKLLNEVQMEWHASATNREREMTGKHAVNSLWIWGGAPAPRQALRSAYSAGFNLPNWLTDQENPGQPKTAAIDAAAVLAARAKNGLLLLDSLLDAALADDMGEWLLRMHALERDWFDPILRALQGGALDGVRLILTNGTVTTEVPVTRNSLRRFWKKPMLDGLLA